MRNLLIALILLMAVPAMAEDVTRRITVVGQGSVEVVPDMATISLGVTTEAETAGSAMARNTQSLEGVMLELVGAGVGPLDMQTTNFSLSPRWSKSGSGQAQNKITGFVASITMAARLRDLDKLGKVLDAVAQNGANTFNGLHFGLQDPQPAQDAARKEAVADALRKAQLYAAAAGVSLGEVLTISEAPQRGVSPVMMTMEADMRQSRAVPVSKGELTVGASITIVFAIN